MICLNFYLSRLVSAQSKSSLDYIPYLKKWYRKDYRIKYFSILLKKKRSIYCTVYNFLTIACIPTMTILTCKPKDLYYSTELSNFKLINERMAVWEYLHQVYLGSGSIYFVWGKHPLTGRVVQDCVRPIYPVSFNPSFQWRQHNTRQHKHISYIDLQCSAR